MYNGVYQWVEAGQLNVDDMVCTVKGYGFVIVSQPSEPKQVYNIAVLEDESYIANGIVVHNCRSGLVPVPITKEIDKNMIFENRDFSGVLDDSAKVDKAFENIDKFNDKYRISKYVLDQDLAARIIFEKGVSVSLRVEVPKKSISNNTPSLLMDGLKTKDIITLHDTLIEKYGGTNGTMIEATIDHLIQYKLSPLKTVFANAAIALHTITTAHAFFDGNKRTAFALADVILRNGGYKIVADKNTTKKMLITVAEYKMSVDAIEEWIRRNTAEL